MMEKKKDVEKLKRKTRPRADKKKSRDLPLVASEKGGSRIMTGGGELGRPNGEEEDVVLQNSV